MRRRVMLIIFLCLAAAAVVMAQAFHLRLHIDAVLAPHAAFASLHSPAHAPLAAVNTSPPASSSERDSAVHAERSEQTDKSKIEASQASGTDQPKIDVARISSSGSPSVFAGRAAPGALVSVLENGVTIATATANANGDWSLVTEHRFSSPDPKISLRAGPPKAQDQDNQKPLSSAQPPALASEAASHPVSPSVALLKNFESKVASAREEEQARRQTESAAAATGVPEPAVPSVGGPTSDVSEVSPAQGSLRDSAQLQSASIPVPMTFVFDEATLTPDGQKTARLLLEYLHLKKFTSVTLSGHADERGTAEYNMELSRKRLDTISAFLRDGGYQGKMELLPEGATQPFTGIDRSKYSRDDLMQLDRRVELRNAM